ncbi:hypothetical protein AWH48_09700 [Domibacillus aminovorans]|uniref:Serine aminopeptidase S33 domain-containing protein n=1 Tax=Domibacillus aminovorans TaxID=29332 RepID=A0A177KLV1_9BACI|nr:hypothetical protein AWH48_09700 [Domibacillus aminovorans]
MRLPLKKCTSLAEDRKYLFRFAEYVPSKKLAQVYTLNLRGYGMYPKRRRDVDYIDQIDDNLADLMNWIRRDNPNTKIILA